MKDETEHFAPLGQAIKPEPKKDEQKPTQVPGAAKGVMTDADGKWQTNIPTPWHPPLIWPSPLIAECMDAAGYAPDEIERYGGRGLNP